MQFCLNEKKLDNRKIGGHQYKEVDVVSGDRSFDDFNILCLAYLPDEVSQSFCNLS